MNIGALRVLAVQEVDLAPGLRHIEIYTMSGLVTMLWHGRPDAEHVVLMGGGAMGGLLGPADGLYQDLGVQLVANGIAAIRVGYREPNNLPSCIGDLAAESAARISARLSVTEHGGESSVRKRTSKVKHHHLGVSRDRRSSARSISIRLNRPPPTSNKLINSCV